MSDNRKHRSENMTCKTCMWFVPKASNKAAEFYKQVGDLKKKQDEFVTDKHMVSGVMCCSEEPVTEKMRKGCQPGQVYTARELPELTCIGRCRRHAPTMSGRHEDYRWGIARALNGKAFKAC